MNKIAIGFGIGLPIGLVVGIKISSQNISEFLFPNQSFKNQFWKRSAKKVPKKFYDPMVDLPIEIVEMIFLHLDCVDLLKCLSVSKSWNRYLKDPRFWLKKCAQKTFSPEVQAKWNTLVSLTERPQTEYLKNNFTPFLGSIRFNLVKNSTKELIGFQGDREKFPSQTRLLNDLMNSHNAKMIEVRKSIARSLMKSCKNSEMIITPLHAALKFKEILLIQFMVTHSNEMNFIKEVPDLFRMRPIGYKEENELILLMNKLKKDAKDKISRPIPENIAIRSDLRKIVELMKKMTIH